MDFPNNYIFCQGYLAGYQDGLKDGASGRAANTNILSIQSLPIKAMGLSTRANHCLASIGCETVGDVAVLSYETIAGIRNLGPKTASEIAHWLTEHDVLSGGWSEYL